MKMTIYAYFRKLIKSTSVMLRLKLPRVLKFTFAGREFDDVAKLQGAINLITDWAREWQLQVSVNKCSLLNIAHVPFDVTYHINGSSLSYQSNCRDLGVIITHDLSPSIHI